MPKRNRVIRNPVAQSPLLRKGGAHTQSRTGQRVRSRVSVSSAIEDWQNEIEVNDSLNTNKESENSPYLIATNNFSSLFYNSLPALSIAVNLNKIPI